MRDLSKLFKKSFYDCWYKSFRMNLKEHRIYAHVGKRVRLFGLGTGEWVCVLLGLYGVMAFESLLCKTLSIGAMATLAVISRRLRKLWVGVSFRSALRWTTGVEWRTPSFVPASHKRELIG